MIWMALYGEHSARYGYDEDEDECMMHETLHEVKGAFAGVHMVFLYVRRYWRSCSKLALYHSPRMKVIIRQPPPSGQSNAQDVKLVPILDLGSRNLAPMKQGKIQLCELGRAEHGW